MADGLHPDMESSHGGHPDIDSEVIGTAAYALPFNSKLLEDAIDTLPASIPSPPDDSTATELSSWTAARDISEPLRQWKELVIDVEARRAVLAPGMSVDSSHASDTIELMVGLCFKADPLSLPPSEPLRAFEATAHFADSIARASDRPGTPLHGVMVPAHFH